MIFALKICMFPSMFLFLEESTIQINTFIHEKHMHFQTYLTVSFERQRVSVPKCLGILNGESVF